MSEAVDDMVAYTKLTDNVIIEIMQSDDPNLAASRHILESIHKRQLYKCVGQTQPPENTTIKKVSGSQSSSIQTYPTEYP